MTVLFNATGLILRVSGLGHSEAETWAGPWAAAGSSEWKRQHGCTDVDMVPNTISDLPKDQNLEGPPRSEPKRPDAVGLSRFESRKRKLQGTRALPTVSHLTRRRTLLFWKKC